jgi:hypothetical protein
LGADRTEGAATIDATCCIITGPIVPLCTIIDAFEPEAKLILPFMQLGFSAFNKTPLEAAEGNGNLACIDDKTLDGDTERRVPCKGID